MKERHSAPIRYFNIVLFFSLAVGVGVAITIGVGVAIGVGVTAAVTVAVVVAVVVEFTRREEYYCVPYIFFYIFDIYYCCRC